MLDMFTRWPSSEAIRWGTERLCAIDDTPEVDVHHPLEILERGDLDVTRERDARDVVAPVHRAEMRIHRIGVCQHGFPLGHVQAVGFDLRALVAQLLLGARQTVGVESLIASLAPRRASSVASACPMPEPAPGTTATLPAKVSTAAVSQGRVPGQCASGTIRDMTVEKSR
jgi:hypothetical protein